jgi:NADH-quinone oxidoreductase subunit K
MSLLIGITSILLFTMGIMGVLIRRNPLVILMSIELMLNATNLGLILTGRIFQNLDAQILIIFIIAVAAAEISVGLGILVTLFMRRDDFDVDRINLFKG